MPEYRVLPAGDTALVVEFGDRIDRRLSAFVLALARALDNARLPGIVETVPTFRSLMVHYEPLVVSASSLTARIASMMQVLRPSAEAGRLWRLPACYDPSLAPDLGDVSNRTGLSSAQVIERHCAPTYHVYMLGFLPGQAYMGDLPAELTLARRATPRLKIPAGSLAMAMGMTCIFPMETPCGWHLIGRSPVALWNSAGALLAPGDAVTFAPISLREYEALSARASEGKLEIAPVDQAFGAAA